MNTYHQSIDAAAEAEGLAALTFATYGLSPYDPPRHVRRAMQIEAAAELGIKFDPAPCYKPQLVAQAIERIARAPMSFLVWGPNPSKRVPETIEARKRQAERRLRRAGLLIQLQHMRDRDLTIPEARALSGLGERTLQRACANGRIPARYRDGQYVIRLRDLRTALAAKLAGRPIGQSTAA